MALEFTRLVRSNYDELDNIPVIRQDLTASFTKQSNTYYIHTGSTTSAYTKGRMYYCDGTNLKKMVVADELPAVNDGKLTITVNGTAYTFSANQAGNTSFSITNTDTGATSVEVTGTGNAVTAASYDSSTRKLTLTKGISFQEKLIAGSNITISGNTISAKDTTYTFTANNPTLAWSTKSKIGTIGGVEFNVTMPANPNTDTGATSVEVPSAGNALTGASYDASKRKITFTKGTFLTSHQDISGKLTGTKFKNAGGATPSFNTYLPYSETGGGNTRPAYLLSFINNSAGSGLTYSSTLNALNATDSFKVYTQSALYPVDCTQNGFYYVNTNPSGSTTDAANEIDPTHVNYNPFLQYHSTAHDFRILTTAYSSLWLQQIATDFRSEFVYIRRCESGTWQPWVMIPSELSNHRVFPDNTVRDNYYKALYGNVDHLPSEYKFTSQSNATFTINTDKNNRTQISDGKIRNYKSGNMYDLAFPTKTGTFALTSDILTKISQLTNDSGFTSNKGTVTQVSINGATKSPTSAGLIDLGSTFVTTNTTQTISGKKTFTAGLKIKNWDITEDSSGNLVFV